MGSPIMARQIVFEPREGERNSPAALVDAIEDKDEQQTLRLRLEMLSQREPHTWAFSWCKYYEKAWQLRTTHYRVILRVG